jgi:hypothetical protein
MAIAVFIGYFYIQSQEYNCRLVATKTSAFANRMIDYADSAAQREDIILNQMRSNSADMFLGGSEIEPGLDPNQRVLREWQLSSKSFHNRIVLESQLTAIVQENNSSMTKLAKESYKHRTAILDSCFDGDYDLAPELGFSLDSDKRAYDSRPLNKRFEDFIKLAEQLEELAARAIGDDEKALKIE